MTKTIIVTMISPIGSCYRSVHGLQLSLFHQLADELNGMQLSCVSAAEHGNGLQIGLTTGFHQVHNCLAQIGLINVISGHDGHSLQLGLFKLGPGLKIGLLNYYQEMIPLISW